MGRIRLSGENGGKGFSGLWAGCPLLDGFNDGLNAGYGIVDDFCQIPYTGTITSQAAWGGNWKAYGTSNNTLTDGSALVGATPPGEGGQLLMTQSTTGDQLVIQSVSLPFQISSIAGGLTQKLWFECRLALSSITAGGTTASDLFVGLATQQTLSGTVPFSSAATLATGGDFVGFRRLGSAGATGSTLYQANGVSPVVSNTNKVVFAANTFTRLGFMFDPVAATLKFYQEGVQLGTYITSTDLAAASESDFPNGVMLSPCIALWADSSAPGTARIDWIACYQNRANS